MNGLLIGRFQPFHLGHIDAIKFALSKVDKLWLGIGSSNKPLTKENPFSADERKEMILNSLEPETLQKIEIYYIPDLDNHKKWIENLDNIVPKYEIVFSNDEMTHHLYSKRKIPVVSIPFTNRNHFSGTNIRQKIISDQKWYDLVPDGSKKILENIDAKDRLSSL